MVRRLFWRRRLNRVAAWVIAAIFILAAGAESIPAMVEQVRRILVERHRDLRIEFRCSEHQVIEKTVIRVTPGSAAGLNDYRGFGLASSLHDRLNLLHVVHVKGGDAVIVLSRVVQQDAKRNQCHDALLQARKRGPQGPLFSTLPPARMPDARSRMPDPPPARWV